MTSYRKELENFFYGEIKFTLKGWTRERKIQKIKHRSTSYEDFSKQVFERADFLKSELWRQFHTEIEASSGMLISRDLESKIKSIVDSLNPRTSPVLKSYFEVLKEKRVELSRFRSGDYSPLPRGSSRLKEFNSLCSQVGIPPYNKFSPNRKFCFEYMEKCFERGVAAIMQHSSDDLAYLDRLTSKGKKDWKSEEAKKEANFAKSLKEKKSILAKKQSEVANARKKMEEHLQEARDASEARIQTVKDEISRLENDLNRFGGEDKDSLNPFESSEFL